MTIDLAVWMAYLPGIANDLQRRQREQAGIHFLDNVFNIEIVDANRTQFGADQRLMRQHVARKPSPTFSKVLRHGASKALLIQFASRLVAISDICFPTVLFRKNFVGTVWKLNSGTSYIEWLPCGRLALDRRLIRSAVLAALKCGHVCECVNARDRKGIAVCLHRSAASCIYF